MKRSRLRGGHAKQDVLSVAESQMVGSAQRFRPVIGTDVLLRRLLQISRY